MSEVSLIAAEDTRHSRKLLSHYDIHTSLTSYFDHSNEHKLDNLLAALQIGDIALISDAGMPAINDPGYALVRAALGAGHEVSPIPGPSAPISAWPPLVFLATNSSTSATRRANPKSARIASSNYLICPTH